MIFIKTSFWTVQESMGKVCLGRDRDKKISQDAQKQKKSKHKAELLIFKKIKTVISLQHFKLQMLRR